jgi:hypothetical protein
MQKDGAWDRIQDEVASLFFAERRQGDTDAYVRAVLKKRLKHDAHFSMSVLRTIQRSGQETMRPTNKFLSMASILQSADILIAEVSGRYVHHQLSDLSDQTVVSKCLQTFARKAGIPPEDEINAAASTQEEALLLMIVYQYEPRILDIVLNRPNKITAVEMSEAMFADMQKAILDSFFNNIGGALGAREVAKKIGESLSGHFLDGVLPKEYKDRLMLWARTEGAVIQNDALMKIGREAGMNGKIWQTVGDDRVRERHVTNEADGVIPVDRAFSGGSMDAGSGSASPFNCRCTTGPALL